MPPVMSAAEATPKSETASVTARLAELEYTLDGVHEAIDALSSKLQPILRQHNNPAKAQANCADTETDACDIGRDLRAKTMHAGLMQSKLWLLVELTDL